MIGGKSERTSSVKISSSNEHVLRSLDSGRNVWCGGSATCPRRGGGCARALPLVGLEGESRLRDACGRVVAERVARGLCDMQT